MSINNNRDEYLKALEKAHKDYPIWTDLKYTPDSCPFHDYSFIIFCDDSEWDIARCRNCGDEKVVPCSFDDEYS